MFGGYLDLTDGLRDVVTTNYITRAYKDQPIAVLLNKGHGRLEVATTSIFEGQPTRVQWARETVVADFNRDGRPDLFFADTGAVTDLPDDPRPGHHNELALSTPSGKLVDATATLPQHSGFTHSAAAADVDGNGTVDLFLGNFDCCGDKTPAEILLNDGAGHFREATDRGGARVADYVSRRLTAKSGVTMRVLRQVRIAWAWRAGLLPDDVLDPFELLFALCLLEQWSARTRGP